MKRSELKKRTKQFGVAVMKLVKDLPDTPSGQAVHVPLVRCGVAIGAVCTSACRSKNQWDFTSKMHTIEEAADEAVYWLELAQEGELLKRERVEPILAEIKAMRKIFTASRKASEKRVRERYKHTDPFDPGAPPGSSFDDDDIPF